MMSKIVILAIFAICASQAAPAPGLLASAVVAPYASSYNAHTVNHAISAPIVAAPAYSQYVAAPAAYSAYSALPAAYSAYATGFPTAYSAFPGAYAGLPAAYSALPASYVL